MPGLRSVPKQGLYRRTVYYSCTSNKMKTKNILRPHSVNNEKNINVSNTFLASMPMISFLKLKSVGQRMFMDHLCMTKLNT
jgi:hypothetical protein